MEGFGWRKRKEEMLQKKERQGEREAGSKEAKKRNKKPTLWTLDKHFPFFCLFAFLVYLFILPYINGERANASSRKEHK